MFEEFKKTARYSRDCVISEKIDGTNAQIYIGSVAESGYLKRVGITNMIEHRGHFFGAGARSGFVTPDNDNHGFAKWAYDHVDELIDGLGFGRHFGEWWGQGIQRKYGLNEKRFSLFNTIRWCAHDAEPLSITNGEGVVKVQQHAPKCCHVVPVLYRGVFGGAEPAQLIEKLRHEGSVAAPGFPRPEGIVIYHMAAGIAFKKTLERDEMPKSFTKKEPKNEVTAVETN